VIISQPGDPIWLREGVFIISSIVDSGIPVGTTLDKPKRGLFIERQTIHGRDYIKAYIDGIGERLIQEIEVLELL
jgi:hypothetical protein